jgi:maltooligosyltrehalose synthase
VTGAKREHLFGFSRCQGDRGAIVAAPRLFAHLLSDGHEAPLGKAVWQDTRLLVPGIDPERPWRHVFTGESMTFAVEDGQPTLAAGELMAHFPVALLVASEP